MRKVLLEKWQKNRCGARFQKEWIRKDVVRSRAGGCVHQGFEVFGCVGDPGHDRRTAQTNAQPSFSQSAHCIKTQIRARRSRLKDPCEIGIQSRNGDVNGEFI